MSSPSLAPSASSFRSVAPSASTLAMSDDRRLLGKINGHLFIAGKALMEGHTSSMNEVRHEIRAILSGNADMTSQSVDDSAHPDADSVLGWQKMVIRLIRSTRHIQNSGVSDDMKKELARLIKRGRVLCSGGGSAADEAKAQIAKAKQLYMKLSGMSYL